jgi:hypothetical protein
MSSWSMMEEWLIEEGAELIIRYGSWISEESDSNDCDIVALYRTSGHRSNFELADWDVIRLSMYEFNGYIRTLDPINATEPLLTGELSYGNAWEFEALRDGLFETEPSEQAIRHNLCDAVSEFQRAQQFRDGSQYSRSVQALAFCLSHWATAWWYARENPPTRIEEVLAGYGARELYDKLRLRAKAIEDEHAPTKTIRRLEHRVCYSIFGVDDSGSAISPK